MPELTEEELKGQNARIEVSPLCMKCPCAGRLKYVGGKFVATSFDLYLTMEIAQLGDLFAFK